MEIFSTSFFFLIFTRVHFSIDSGILEHGIRKIYLRLINIIQRTPLENSPFERYANKTASAEKNIFELGSFKSNMVIVTFCNDHILINRVFAQALDEANLWEGNILVLIIAELWVDVAAEGDFSIFEIRILDEDPGIKEILELKVYISELVEFGFMGSEIFLGAVCNLGVHVALSEPIIFKLTFKIPVVDYWHVVEGEPGKFWIYVHSVSELLFSVVLANGLKILYLKELDLTQSNYQHTNT